MRVVCAFPLRTARGRAQRLSADGKQRLDRVTVLMMRLEVARLTVSWLLENLVSSGHPSPCLDITCSFESQVTGAIDLHDLS